MEYHRVSRGVENKYLHRTAQFDAMQSRITKIIDRIRWRLFKIAFCPNCLQLTSWEVGAIQLRVFKTKDPKYVIGVSHTCLKCKLQIRKGLDKASEQEIGGIYRKDYTSKV